MAIPKSKSEHAIKMIEAITSILGVGFEDDFGIRIGAEDMSAGFQFFFQIFVAVNLTIENNGERMGVVFHRLVTVRQVDY